MTPASKHALQLLEPQLIRSRELQVLMNMADEWTGGSGSYGLLLRGSRINPFKPSGAKWLHYKVFKAILV